jgi:hypothetical protein
MDSVDCRPSIESIAISNEDEGIIVSDAPTERIFLSKVRRWQVFPGNTDKFCFDGLLMYSPERVTFYRSFAVIHFLFFFIELRQSFMTSFMTLD